MIDDEQALQDAYAEGRKDEREFISRSNLLLKDRDRLRESLARLHAWVLAEQGDCIYSAGHPVAQAAAALTGLPLDDITERQMQDQEQPD